MLRYVLTRISLVVPTFIGITLLTFFIIRLIPGDPIELLAGEHGIDPARHELLRHQFGFDRPVLVQYADYVGKILHGDLGESLSTRQPVLREFGELFPATIELSASAMLFASLLSGQDGAFISVLSHLILPMIVLGTIPLAVIARMTRSSMLEVLNEDYIRTARAKGLSPPRVVWIHALRNALIPVVTVIGLQVGTLMGGAILTENIFSWPGVGSWLVNSIYQRDYPSVQGGVLLIAGFVIIVNLSVDLIYGMLNPRIR